jgi:diguanylate cyclase (GGDEF)-like protein/PAS domain S-box-containing protein
VNAAPTVDDDHRDPDVDVLELQARLAEAEETLRAIRSGEVDALVVRDASPNAQVFTLSSADRPYRMFVENMRDGAATVSESGVVLYANRRLASLVARPLGEIMGAPIDVFIAEGDRAALQSISGPGAAGGTVEADLLTGSGEMIAVRINTSTLEVDQQEMLCVTFADVTEQNAQRSEIERLGRAQAERMRDLEQAQAALTQQATHDALTGLPNRNLFLDRVTQALALGRRAGTSTGVIFVDLDHFKEINDTQGHAAGDVVLREVAERLQEAVRPMDSVARLGGDEYVVLLPALQSAENANDVALRIASAVDLPIKLDHGAVAVRASLGIAVTNPTATERDPLPDRLLQQADTAMYHAKSLGGSRTKLFDPARTPSMLDTEREPWIMKIREALDQKRFVLHAQPIVDLVTGAVIRHELLLRMSDRDGNIVPPMDFLPTAERCGLIGEIDQWVITEATRIAGTGQSVAVNLSAASAGDPTVLDLIERGLVRHATEPGNLMFEITETAVMQHVERGRLFAEHLVGLGCRFALDDFGTGFGSFTYLKQLPVQFLKIDIEFVRDLLRSPRDMSVVRAIVALAAGFGQQTIAEGVEDEQTAAVLRDLGVTFAQGYLFGRPAPLAVAANGQAPAATGSPGAAA